jgi:hypothetical protein
MSYFAWIKQPFREVPTPQIIHDEKMEEYKKPIVVTKHPCHGESIEQLVKLYPAPALTD